MAESIAEAIAANDAIGEEHADGEAGGVQAICEVLGIDWVELNAAMNTTHVSEHMGPLARAVLEGGFLYGVRWERNRG